MNDRTNRLVGLATMLIGAAVLFVAVLDVGLPLWILMLAVLALAVGTALYGLGSSIGPDRPADV
jgi:hypothetical protein